MESISPLLLGALVVIGLGIWSLWQNRQAQNGWSALQKNFESLQQSFLQQQREVERSQEIRNSTLRGELSQEMQNTRRELQAGLNGHFDRVQEHLKNAHLQLQGLNVVGQSINDLNNLLKLPHLRGGFGEAALERLLADWLPTDGYELQYRVVPGSAERVDAVVKYPKYVLPIDSKFPREQVLPLFETNDPRQLETARRALSEVIRQQARQIREKYIHPEHGTADMALLFVPSETLYFEILRNPRLGEDLAKQKVFAVSPNTLAVTLHAVSTSRAYYEMARGVEKTILDVKKAKQHLDSFEQRFVEVGAALGKAQNAFNVASTHLSRYTGAVVRLTGSASLGDADRDAEAAPSKPGAEELTVPEFPPENPPPALSET